MLSIQLDSTGVWQMRWPKKHALIIALVEEYLAYESNLPPEQRVSAPALSQVQEASDRAKTMVAAVSSGEAIRATAAETYRQTMHQARPLLEIALLRLKGKYAANLAQLESWGLATKEGKRGVSVRKPANQSQWANFLLSYVAQESSRPEEDRIADPSLEQMAALAETVQQSSEARKGGRDQRESAVEARRTAVAELLDLLQVAAAVLVVTQFGGRVTNDLQQWGYTVVAR